MTHSRMAGPALVAAVALFAIFASTASATEFIYGKDGNLTGRSLTVQRFRLGQAKVECRAATPSGVVQGKFQELPMTVTYSQCQIEGRGTTQPFSMGERWLLPPAVSFENTVDVRAEILKHVCALAIGGEQSLGSGTGEVEYENSSGELILDSHITGIDYEVIEST